MIRIIVDKRLLPGPTLVGAPEIAAHNAARAEGREWTVADHRRFHPRVGDPPPAEDEP